ncbi:histone-lysine N-methyltransferase ASHR3-like [Bidens hawaiensis]|uniref:histone-lysine N-methyltransferase ASHR3-like n=1 Tax=Bidens hawaiensis TaxID=980011 RepID=UPI00404B75F0
MMWITALNAHVALTYAMKIVYAGNSSAINMFYMAFVFISYTHNISNVQFCRSVHISCTSACACSENCTNRPFDQEDKKVKVVKTKHCGWGVEADEFIDKGDYIIEYVGEAIDDALCEKRFWDMKGKRVTNFYVVAVRKDLNIDAQFKGNESRFINHSCDPNCIMEKWDVNGETRLGIFAAKAIEPKEALTFDYGYRLSFTT